MIMQMPPYCTIDVVLTENCAACAVYSLYWTVRSSSSTGHPNVYVIQTSPWGRTITLIEQDRLRCSNRPCSKPNPTQGLWLAILNYEQGRFNWIKCCRGSQQVRIRTSLNKSCITQFHHYAQSERTQSCRVGLLTLFFFFSFFSEGFKLKSASCDNY